MNHKYKYLTDEFLKKSEIGKYIEVLNAGYTSFAPITIDDYNSSIMQMESILEHLQCLNYDKLMVETTSDQIDKLIRSKVSNEDFIYQLHFIRDREILIKEVPKMFEEFKNYAKELVCKGLWTEEQRFKYATYCNDITKLFVEQLNNFWACVGDIGYKPQKQQQKTIELDLKNGNLHRYCLKAISKGYLEKKEDGEYIRTKEWTKAQLAYFLGKFLKDGDQFPDKKYSQMFNEHRLGKAYAQLINNKTGNGKPIGYELIDALFEEE